MQLEIARVRQRKARPDLQPENRRHCSQDDQSDRRVGEREGYSDNCLASCDASSLDMPIRQSIQNDDEPGAVL
jgi:hypothetical protein